MRGRRIKRRRIADHVLEQVELTYSFDLDSRLSNLRLLLPAVETHLPSISSIYGCAVLYENEIHDLFGVTFQTACNWHDGFSTPTGDKVLTAMRLWPEEFFTGEAA